MRRRRTGSRLNVKVEALLKDFLARIAEASYQVALKLGFRGSFITFLSDLQEALEEVVRKDRAEQPHARRRPAGRASVH